MSSPEGVVWDGLRGVLVTRALGIAADLGIADLLGAGPRAKWLDLLLLALFAGRERDERQRRHLLDDAGFDVIRIGGGVIEARCR